MITKESILSSNDVTIDPVDVPEWGGQVFVRSMTGTARDQYEVALSNQKTANGGTLNNVRATLAVYTVCDESGKLIFSPDDAGSLATKSAKVLNRIWQAATKLNGIGDDEVKDAQKN